MWEFYNERRCVRTYAGHSQAVRDVNFNNTGTEFLSASYDKTVKLWDTETGRNLIFERKFKLIIFGFLGQVKSKFSMRKIPYCISFNPSEHKQHLFICGMSDKKILCVSFEIRLPRRFVQLNSKLLSSDVKFTPSSQRKLIVHITDKVCFRLDPKLENNLFFPGYIYKSG